MDWIARKLHFSGLQKGLSVSFRLVRSTEKYEDPNALVRGSTFVRRHINYTDVFDGDSIPGVSDRFQYEIISSGTASIEISPENEVQRAVCPHCSQEHIFGLKPYKEWSILRFRYPEGLIFIRNPFTAEGQRYWISKCIQDYPCVKDHITNITNLEKLQSNTSGGKRPTPNKNGQEDFYRKLRWITFGYHHDWDTKIYSEESKCAFPEDLADLTKYMSLVLGYNDFKAEAAIVNYYNMDSTLSGHQDRSEIYQDAPLFSISFGQTAIFLIGGETKEMQPLPVYLKSGDVVVMTGKSRLSFHGVPKVLGCNAIPLPWNDLRYEVFEKSDPESSEIKESNPHSPLNEPEAKKMKIQDNVNTSDNHDHDSLYGRGLNKTKQSICHICSFVENYNRQEYFSTVRWNDFLDDYSQRCRFNLNVRQVLFPGQTTLQFGCTTK